MTALIVNYGQGLSGHTGAGRDGGQLAGQEIPGFLVPLEPAAAGWTPGREEHEGLAERESAHRDHVPGSFRDHVGGEEIELVRAVGAMAGRAEAGKVIAAAVARGGGLHLHRSQRRPRPTTKSKGRLSPQGLATTRPREAAASRKRISASSPRAFGGKREDTLL